MSLVLSMARELIELDMARAIPPLSTKATYIVSPLAPIHSISSASQKFKSRFPTAPTLSTILSTISTGPPRSWGNILSQHILPADVLPYLIRLGWLTQLREFYFIRISKEIKCSCGADDDVDDSILIDPFRASREEVRWIKTLAEKVGGARGGMFERLCKYFDGKSAKEKILRREQVERSELEGMIDAFRRIGGIVVAQHW
jgi:hypothetical protein